VLQLRHPLIVHVEHIIELSNHYFPELVRQHPEELAGFLEYPYWQAAHIYE
jgi:hypothetical protein